MGPGTGIAPFRSFWQHRYALMKQNQQKVGKMWLFFGCRTKDMDLYKEEKVQMQNAGVLDRVFLALSREPNIPKVIMPQMNVSSCLISSSFPADLRPEFGSKRGCRNLSIFGDWKRSLLCLWWLHNGWACVPNAEIYYSKVWRHDRSAGSKLYAVFKSEYRFIIKLLY